MRRGGSRLRYARVLALADKEAQAYARSTGGSTELEALVPPPPGLMFDPAELRLAGLEQLHAALMQLVRAGVARHSEPARSTIMDEISRVRDASSRLLSFRTA
jgi:hypothetical protein